MTTIDGNLATSATQAHEAPCVVKHAPSAQTNQRERLIFDSDQFLRKVQNGIRLFHDSWDLIWHPDSLGLLAAQSSHGKSTFCYQTAAHAIINGRRVLILSNEMNARAYIGYIGRAVANWQGGMTLVEGIRRCVESGLLLVEDTYTSGAATQCFDALVPFTMSKIAEFKPDVVLVDQISNATRASDMSATRNESHVKLKHISEGFNLEINANRHLPPILMFQQALNSAGGKDKKPGEVDMMANLRGGKDTFTDATHGVYISRTADNVTKLSVQKQRYHSRHDPISDFVMNGKWILVPLAEALAASNTASTAQDKVEVANAR